ncbi:aldo/keto reductase [Caulobacter sp. S45]|uniref:aldo/keto reductase n=1 Tax=Caulobacter sp. S45 TaxID=1641861 RepID=UPI0020B17081|nr:aldo/keto reductase [Caulobacter sp. S45]
MGLSSVYGRAEDEASIKTLHRAIDLGITFFDTATGYGSGHNEALLGRALRDRRDGLVVASKFIHRPHGSDAPPIRARDAVEASLKRLGLDHIDLYYLHRVDPSIPIEESVGELGRLQGEGKIGGVGVSEASADGLRRAHGVHPLTALQSEYSLWTRDVEVEILPTARELGIGFVAYSPLGRGFLAGSQVVDADDRRHVHPRFKPEAVAANGRRREVIAAVAQRLGATTAQVSLAWVLSKGVVPIPGTRHIAHLEANWAANDLALDAASAAELEAAFPLGSTVGERYPAEQLKLVPAQPVAA